MNLIVNKLFAFTLWGEPEDGCWYRNLDLYNTITGGIKSHHWEQLCFHESWDWLMLVVNASIETCKQEFGDTDKLGEVYRALMKCDKEATYKALTVFYTVYYARNKAIDENELLLNLSKEVWE